MKVVWTPVPPPVINVVRVEGSRLFLSGTGPANQPFHTLASSSAVLPPAQWTPIATNTIDSQGGFSTTNVIAPDNRVAFYLLRVP
jgi:hypothetical protein